MADVIFVAVICAFFALCVVYIRWCDRIVGPDQFTTDNDSPEAAGATATSIALAASPSGQGSTVEVTA